MKKFIAFCKSYLAEILFAVVSVLTLLLTVHSAIHYSGVFAVIGIISAVVLQAFLGTLIQKYAPKDSLLHMHYTVWFYYIFAFMLLMSGCYFCFLWTGNVKIELIGALGIVMVVVMLVLYRSIQPPKAKKPQGPFLEPLKDKDEPDPVPEPAEKSAPAPQKPKAEIKISPKKHEARPKATQKKTAKPVKIGNKFDLLCMVGNQKVRLPFEKRGLGTPIGIFPFKNKPEYLELDEVENKKHTDPDVDASRLLDERFCCGRVSKITDQLNAYLRELGKPQLEGSYLADSTYMQGCGWIIGFDNTGDYHGGNVPAKLRYMGRFYGKCKE